MYILYIHSMYNVYIHQLQGFCVGAVHMLPQSISTFSYRFCSSWPWRRQEQKPLQLWPFPALLVAKGLWDGCLGFGSQHFAPAGPDYRGNRYRQGDCTVCFLGENSMVIFAVEITFYREFACLQPLNLDFILKCGPPKLTECWMEKLFAHKKEGICTHNVPPTWNYEAQGSAPSSEYLCKLVTWDNGRTYPAATRAHFLILLWKGIHVNHTYPFLCA